MELALCIPVPILELKLEQYFAFLTIGTSTGTSTGTIKKYFQVLN